MAIYRTGQASMDADGYITGYGTKWKTALTLIRPGATIVFASNPVSYATISEIVNDTSLRATSTGGAVVPRGDYVILLHDSITVDGLAQDVAETLRYYQGQETMYQEFVEFLKGFDWQKLEEIDRNTEANAAAADASARAAAQSESNANASKNAAAASATTASQQASAAASSASAAKVSENNAASSKTAAANSASAAASSATTASQHKDAAAASASAAKTSETNASASKTAAASSASAAKTSETNAKSSETNAASSASAANTAKNAAQTAASSANASKSAAENSATAAAGSATTAKNEADRAAELAKQLDATNLMRKDANLSDVVNKATARANLQVDRLNQDSTNETRVLSADGAQALVTPNGSTWGLYRFGSGWIPLGVSQGGTGANDVNGARTNLKVDKHIQGADRTLILSPQVGDDRYALMVHQSGVWGCYNEKDFQYVALKIDQGGTGAKDAAGARENIGLGVSSIPEFRSLELGKSNKDSAAYVDFHYGAKYEYDARIVCDGYNSDQVGGGNLRFHAGFLQLNSKGSTNITGGRLTVNTSDVVFQTQTGLSSGSIQVPASADATAPIGAGVRGIHAGTDSNNFDNASNINLYSWYGVAFCTAYTSPTNGIKQGKPAVLINTRDGNINTLGVVISKGVTLTSDFDKKADVTELDGEFVSDLLDKVGTYSYRYKDGSRYTAGVIAQELQNWMPQLVSSNDADGSLQVDYMGLLGYMHAAFKDEKAKRKSLEDRVKKLESYLAFKFPEDFEE